MNTQCLIQNVPNGRAPRQPRLFPPRARRLQPFKLDIYSYGVLEPLFRRQHQYWTRSKSLLLLAVWIFLTFLVLPSTSVGQGILSLYWADFIGEKILRSNVGGTDIEDIVTGGARQTFGLAVDPLDQRIYWNDGVGDSLTRANLDGSFPETLLTMPGGLQGGIAIDYVRDRLYFFDGSGSLLRANLDGSDLEVVLSGLIFPRGVALDTAGDHVYWTELGSAGDGPSSRRIARSTLDGDNVETIVDRLVQPVALALDLMNGKIYWLDDIARLVQRSNLDGSGVETLVSNFSFSRIGGASGIALDLDGDRFFWTHSTGRVLSTSLDGSETTIVVDGLGRNHTGPIALLPDVEPAFTISSRLNGLLLGAPFSLALQVRGGTQPFLWNVESGELPTGLVLRSDGTLEGRPTELGQFTFLAQVIDLEANITTKQFDVEVGLALPPNEIRLSKGCTQAVPGRVQGCFITAENAGAAEINQVSIIETPMPSGAFAIESASPEPTLAFQEFLLWELQSIGPGDVRRFSYEARVSPELTLGAPVTGQAKLLCSDCIQRCEQLKTRCEGVLPFSTAGRACGQTKKECDQCIEERICQGAQALSETTGARDPNEKIGLLPRFVRSNTLLHYQIYFENIGEIEARDVFIHDPVDEKLDANTLRGVVAGGRYDESTRTLGWTLLDRNLLPGETDSVAFSIRPIPGLPSGTEVLNDAEIQFEVFEPLVTPEVVNIIDDTVPECVMETLPDIITSSTFRIEWSGQDDVGEIEDFWVYASEDGGLYRPIVTQTEETSETFTGEDGKTYDFLCVAVDTAGNAEAQGLIAEASTTVQVQNDGDGDGVPDTSDACPNTDFTMSVIVGGCDSGVANRNPDGCSIMDRIEEITGRVADHDAFVRKVALMARQLVRDGVIIGVEAGAIRQCSNVANLP